MDQDKADKFFEKIKTAKKILLLTHGKPDGDAWSSLCAIIELADRYQKNYLAFCQDEASKIFAFLPNIESATHDKEKIDFNEFDLIITVDCGSVYRTGFGYEIINRDASQKLLEIDHHPKMESFADLEIRYPGAASTSEIIYWLYKQNSQIIDKKIAVCILTGILTDTANFLYPSTSKQTIEIASEMLKLGARLPQVVTNTWRNKSLESMKLWGKAMSGLIINPRYNFAYTVLKLEDIEKSKVSPEELDGISGFISNLHQVRGILLITELPDGQLRGSLRTADPLVNISKLARLLGGGGHAKASGFTLKGKVEKAVLGWKVI